MELPRAYRIRERPLSAEDYDMPVGWWGWNWEPPIPMSLTELLAAGNFDARTAAVVWLTLGSHGSLLIAAEEPHSGKTTTLTAFLDLVPFSVRRVFVRGWAETFDFVRQADPARTLLLANELSSHLPVYLWGPKAVETFRLLRRGYALASTLHADSAHETVQQLTDELGVHAGDLARVDLLMVMRMYRAGAYGPVLRRAVSLHRLAPSAGHGIELVRLAEWRAGDDSFDHDEAAELEHLCLRHGGPLPTLAAELERREAFLRSLCERRVRGIAEVRAALAGFRGEIAPRYLRGDPANA